MFKNYAITAYRNIIRNKYFSMINIAGLSIGMAACILIAHYVVYERSYDRFHQNSANIYRVVNVRHYPTHTDESAGSVIALGPAIKEMFPEVKAFARCYKSERVFSYNGNAVNFSRVFGVDSTFFDVFSFRILTGSKDDLMSRPNTVIVTVSAAKALFGNIDPVGRTILQGEIPYTVEAVMEDSPANSHIKFDVLFSFVTELVDPNYCTTCNNRNTYVLLDVNANPERLQSKMDQVVRKIHPDASLKREYKLQPLQSIHLSSHLRQEHEENGSAKNVMALTAVAVLILCVAWLNYINLTMSMAISRASEVGIRKVNGSTRHGIVLQFMTESIIINLVALAGGLIIVQLAFPAFSLLTRISSFTLFTSPAFWAILVSVVILGSIIYGFYPAFVVSAFKPIQALKGKASLPRSVYAMRLGLVFMQFAFAVILIAGTLTVYKQVSFMKNVDLGMHIEETLVVPIPGELRDAESDVFENELRQHRSIKDVTYTSSVPGNESGNPGGGYGIENAGHDKSLQIYFYYINKNYFDFLGIDFLAGHIMLSDQLNNDRNTELVINDAARKAFGFNSPEEAIGKIIVHDNNIVGKIHGVVKDHHNQSLDNPITPNIFQYTRGKGYYLVKGEVATEKTLTSVKESFQKNYAGYPFQYYFLDDHFNKQYNDHVRFGTLFGLFTILTLFIACLGLTGLSMYATRIRAKELALRKVLGASGVNILLMLSKEYVKLTALAFIAAVPIAYMIMEKWLENFFYRIEIAWWMLAVPGVVVLSLALVTVGIQSLKTALAKPIESLRNE